MNFTRHWLWAILAILLAAVACQKQAPTVEPWNPSNQGMITTPCPEGVAVTGGCLAEATATPAWYQLATHSPDQPIQTPTPDAPHVIPTIRLDPYDYTVQEGESLATIGQKYNVAPLTIAEANQLPDPNALSVGQALVIPAPTPSGSAPDLKIIPDAELVYSPSAIGFDIAAFIEAHDGYLKSYTEVVDGVTLDAGQIIYRVAVENSVNPRILIAALEYVGGWVTHPHPDELAQIYPLGYYDERKTGLYKQLSWAANELNRGFYLHQVNGLAAFLLPDGEMIPLDKTTNSGTVGVQYLASQIYTKEDWLTAISGNGMMQVYQDFFGYPFDYSLEGLIPSDLKQPLMALPFEPETVWSFTGGPHGGWGDGSAWAAIDFAPPGEPMGCTLSSAWAVAVAEGDILYADQGAVILDVDGDGLLQTGWTVLYLHVDSEDRVKPGTHVLAGDRIGHPSCEGGLSSATHLHVARRYNGMWISADGNLPFELDGWVSSGTGTIYDGFLKRGGRVLEAYNGISDDNQIQR